jgi:hypothetical protein
MARASEGDAAPPSDVPVRKSTTMKPSGLRPASPKISISYVPMSRPIPLASESAILWPIDLSSSNFIVPNYPPRIDVRSSVGRSPTDAPGIAAGHGDAIVRPMDEKASSAR